MSNNGYSWKNVRYGSRYQMSQSDHLMRWILIAIFLAIVCHVIVLIAMKKMPIFFNTEKGEIITQSVVVRNVEERDYIEPARKNEIREIKEITEPTETTKNLLEELEMLEEVPEDAEIDFSPTIETPEMLVPVEVPALAGDLESSTTELTAGMNFNESVEDLGSTDDFLTPAVGQITIDPGNQAADEFDPDQFNSELAKGAGGDVADGKIEGFTPLAEMTRLSQADLENAKGMIGSDLLFDFNKATLRESAKNSLLKVVLIIDKNPNMKCWIEGHTDLIGTDEANTQLSLARAEAVRYWLIHSMKIPQERLYVRGLGKSQPIVLSGNQDQQAINRRVEIKMRKNAPSESNSPVEPVLVKKPKIIKPKRNPNLPEILDAKDDAQLPPPKAIPVEADVLADVPAGEAPKAIPVEDDPLPLPEDPVAPKAIPVE
jgi:OmpA-OmpF porin, OOP family